MHWNLNFFAEERDNKDYPLYGQNTTEIFTDYKQNVVLTEHIETIIHLENGMTGQW